MNAARLGAVIVWAQVLVFSASVAGRSPIPSGEPTATGSLVAGDPVGDWQDVGANGAEVSGPRPAYTDITGLEVSVDDQELRVRFHVAEVVPDLRDGPTSAVGYDLAIDTDGDGRPDDRVAIRPESGWDAWAVVHVDQETGGITLIGDALVAHRSLFAAVPLARLSVPPGSRFRGQMRAAFTPDPQSGAAPIMEWQDRLPNRSEEWLELGTFSDEVASGQTIRPPLHDLSSLLEVTPREADFAEVKAQFLAYLDEHPDTITTASHRDIGIEQAHWWDLCEQELSTGRVEPDYTCGAAFQDLLLAYADSRDDDLYDLLDEFVGATVSRYEKGRQREAYRTTLANALAFTPRDHPELFGD